MDADLCTGHGRCYAHAPEVFEPDDEGYNAARGEVAEVAAAQTEAAQRAVDSCPERALTVRER
ncbi:MAG: ferredoxin [Acidimicrobiales bacterium]